LKNIYLLTFLLVSQLLAQPDFVVERDIIQSGKFYNSEIHFFPAEQDYLVYFHTKFLTPNYFLKRMLINLMPALI